jgi:hypothetical protein
MAMAAASLISHSATVPKKRYSIDVMIDACLDGTSGAAFMASGQPNNCRRPGAERMQRAYSDDGDRHFRFHVTGRERVEVLGRDNNSVGHDRGLVGTSFLEFGTTERLTFQI